MEKINIKEIRKTAENYYQNGDFYCSESIIKTLKDRFRPEVGDEVVALASGFPVGMGKAGCTCGAVVGSQMALGLIFGRQKAKGKEKNCWPKNPNYSIAIDKRKYVTVVDLDYDNLPTERLEILREIVQGLVDDYSAKGRNSRFPTWRALIEAESGWFTCKHNDLERFLASIDDFFNTY